MQELGTKRDLGCIKRGLFLADIYSHPITLTLPESGVMVVLQPGESVTAAAERVRKMTAAMEIQKV